MANLARCRLSVLRNIFKLSTIQVSISTCPCLTVRSSTIVSKNLLHLIRTGSRSSTTRQISSMRAWCTSQLIRLLAFAHHKRQRCSSCWTQSCSNKSLSVLSAHTMLTRTGLWVTDSTAYQATLVHWCPVSQMLKWTASTMFCGYSTTTSRRWPSWTSSCSSSHATETLNLSLHLTMAASLTAWLDRRLSICLRRSRQSLAAKLLRGRLASMNWSTRTRKIVSSQCSVSQRIVHFSPSTGCATGTRRWRWTRRGAEISMKSSIKWFWMWCRASQRTTTGSHLWRTDYAAICYIRALVCLCKSFFCQT